MISVVLTKEYCEVNKLNSEELLETIDRFHTFKQYHYALMINGPWGCGKTHFIKDELIPHLKGHEKPPVIMNVSLYGIDDIKDITNAILLNIIQFKAKDKVDTDSKIIQIGSIFAGNFIKTIINRNEVATDGIEEILKKFDEFNNAVIIFDDLERCNCDVNQVLGYINNFVEHTNASVIIVANEEEIGRIGNNKNYELQMMLAANPDIEIETDNSEQHKDRDIFSTQNNQQNKTLKLKDIEARRATLFNSRNQYFAIKEKVIGQTIEYEPDLKTVFTELTNKLSNDALKESIIKEMDCLVGYAISDNHKNIRTFQFFIEKIKTIFDIIDNKYKHVHSQLIQYCYRSSIKYMSGKKLPVWKEEVGLQRFGDFWDFHDYINGFRFVDEYIQGNAIDAVSINHLLENYEKQIIAEGQLIEDPFKKLQNWSTAEDDQVVSWLKDIKYKLDNNEYRVILFPKMLQYIVNFETSNIFKQECTEIWLSMKHSAQTMKEEDLVLLSAVDFFTAQENEKARELFNARQKELVEITGSRVKTSEEITYKQAILDYDKWAESLFELSTADTNLRGHSFMYWLDVDELVKLLIACDNQQLFNFRAALHALYKSHIYYQNEEDDLEHLKELLKKIQDMDKSCVGEIKKIKINWLIQDLENYIKKLTPTDQ